MRHLDDIYQYRQALARCEAGQELSMDDIQALSETDGQPVKDGGRVLLRGPRVCDWVDVGELSRDGLVCLECPWMEEDQVFEVVFEDEDGLDSYRFKAVVSWTRDAGDDLDVGLSFVGAPVHVRRRAPTDPVVNLLERFAA